MDIKKLNELFNTLRGDEMGLLYSGDFSDEVTTKVIGLSNAQFDDGSDMNKLQRKTGFLVAECFQNIVRHNESSIENGFFLTRNDGGILYIASGNIIKNEMVPVLSENLNHLNKLSKDELKEVYLKTLSNNTMSAKGGAGLGLIEMARKTGNKLNFEFNKLSDDLSYFYFQIKFTTDKNLITDSEHNIHKSIELRRLMIENDIFLVYQGDVSMNTILPIMSMAEKSMAQKNVKVPVSKRVYIALLELVQNMSKHGKEYKDQLKGLIVMGEKDGKYIIGGTNFIDDTEKSILRNKLPLYAKMDLEELNLAYKIVLKHGDTENKNGSSLGIIEMARRSSEPMQFDFGKVDDHDIVSILLQI